MKKINRICEKFSNEKNCTKIKIRKNIVKKLYKNKNQKKHCKKNVAIQKKIQDTN